MKRTPLLLLFVTAALGLAACAQDSAEPATPIAAVGVTTTVASAATDTTVETAVTDLGSKYVGSPAAFWFWAPY